jgi:hypothetical protein
LPSPGAERYDYGVLLPQFIAQVVAAFTAFHRSGKAGMTLKAAGLAGFNRP